MNLMYSLINFDVFSAFDKFDVFDNFHSKRSEGDALALPCFKPPAPASYVLLLLLPLASEEYAPHVFIGSIRDRGRSSSFLYSSPARPSNSYIKTNPACFPPSDGTIIIISRSRPFRRIGRDELLWGESFSLEGAEEMDIFHMIQTIG